MKVLLTKDVKGLGKAGEVKEVKDGYGKNFLIGRGFAKLATNEVLKKYESDKRKEKAANEAEIDRLNKLKETLKNLETKVAKKLGNNGHLFGAVTKDEISHAVKEQHNIEIDKKHIEIKKAIKLVGNYDLDVKLGHGIHATLQVEVVGE